MAYDTINDTPTITGGGPVLGRIDQYELVRELGGGGFGTVYLARDTVAGIDVAVKGLPPIIKNNAEELENIRANFALVSRLHHPNIAAALVLHPVTKACYASEDVRQKLRVDSGETLMVMEYAPGVTLAQWRRQFPERKVPMDQALAIVRQVAVALDYAHERKIVHRDVKPANVMIETTPDGEVTARLLDFGLAAEVRSSMGRVSQEVRDTAGTRPYMAPEQWLGDRQGAATDQYALAVMFHELLTGEVPFAGVFETGDPVVMMNVVGRKPVTFPGDLPKTVCLALGRALAKKPNERFTSCGAFVAALEGRGAAQGLGPWKMLLKLLCAFSLLGALGVGGAWFYRQHQVKLREQAQISAEQKAENERMRARMADERARAQAAEEQMLAERARAQAAEERMATERAHSEAEKVQMEKVADGQTSQQPTRVADDNFKSETVVDSGSAKPDYRIVVASGTNIIYTVQSGEMLSSISKKFNVRQIDILRSNPGLAPNKLYVGKRIRLPDCATGFVVESAAESDKETDVAKDGQVKSSFKPYTGPTKEYVVRSGDHIGKIANASGISVRVLKELNGMKSDRIRIGQRLKIPLEKQSRVEQKDPSRPKTEDR